MTHRRGRPGRPIATTPRRTQPFRSSIAMAAGTATMPKKIEITSVGVTPRGHAP